MFIQRYEYSGNIKIRIILIQISKEKTINDTQAILEFIEEKKILLKKLLFEYSFILISLIFYSTLKFVLFYSF